MEERRGPGLCRRDQNSTLHPLPCLHLQTNSPDLVLAPRKVAFVCPQPAGHLPCTTCTSVMGAGLTGKRLWDGSCSPSGPGPGQALIPEDVGQGPRRQLPSPYPWIAGLLTIPEGKPRPTACPHPCPLLKYPHSCPVAQGTPTSSTCPSLWSPHTTLNHRLPFLHSSLCAPHSCLEERRYLESWVVGTRRKLQVLFASSPCLRAPILGAEPGLWEGLGCSSQT